MKKQKNINNNIPEGLQQKLQEFVQQGGGMVHVPALPIPQLPTVCPTCGTCPTCGRTTGTVFPITPGVFPYIGTICSTVPNLM